MTNKLNADSDYAAREYLRDVRQLAEDYADGDESAYTRPESIVRSLMLYAMEDQK